MHNDHAPAPTPLPAAELERLHQQDRLAAGLVAGLMTVIFAIGLVLYGAIAYLSMP
jgi:hypothetical protein